MHDRSALGPADVDDATFTGLVADLLGVAAVTSRCSTPPSRSSPTTWRRSRRPDATWSVDGRGAGSATPYAMFVKVVQSWARSPMFQFVPEEVREFAESSVPWRTEPLAYRSDLASRLPDGLAMPRALGVFDLDEKSASIWLEEVQVVERPWDETRYDRAAYLLGRLAGYPAWPRWVLSGSSTSPCATTRSGGWRTRCSRRSVSEDGVGPPARRGRLRRGPVARGC